MSSLEISRRLTFFSFSLNTQNQRSKYTPFFCCEEVNEEDDKEDTTKSKTRTNETERRVEKTLLLFLSLPNNSASAYEHVFVFPTRRTQDREEIFISEKRDEQRWAKTRRKGRRPRLPPPLRRFRRQKRRVLRRRKATTIQTTANLWEVRRNNTNKFNTNK